MSQHPTDQLIRELVLSGRGASAAEIEAIVNRLATAPFNDRQVRVPAKLRGFSYGGITLGSRATSLDYHLVKRVVEDEQWAFGTTPAEYLQDLGAAVRHAVAKLVVYLDRGGHLAGMLSPNVVPPRRRGPFAEPFLYVVYSADRGRIISGYGVSSEAAVRIPEGAKWLK